MMAEAYHLVDIRFLSDFSFRLGVVLDLLASEVRARGFHAGDDMMRMHARLCEAVEKGREISGGRWGMVRVCATKCSFL
jgi:hypothetical protein